jgi:hypothetical protein
VTVPDFSDVSPVAARAAVAIVATEYVGDLVDAVSYSDVDQDELVRAVAHVAVYALSLWRPDAVFRFLEHLSARFGDPATRERMANYATVVDRGVADGE